MIHLMTNSRDRPDHCHEKSSQFGVDSKTFQGIAANLDVLTVAEHTFFPGSLYHCPRGAAGVHPKATYVRWGSRQSESVYHYSFLRFCV